SRMARAITSGSLRRRPVSRRRCTATASRKTRTCPMSLRTPSRSCSATTSAAISSSTAWACG
ncbi:hypothetical protein H2201_009453, partial [Coniosporium apollinis]